MAVLADHSNDGRSCPVRWGTKAHGTHCREGEARHNDSLEGKMEGTQGPQFMST